MLAAMAISESAERPRRPHPLRLAAQGAAVGLVIALLILLVWKLVAEESGANLVRDIDAGKKPAAPAFDLSVIWPDDGTWPDGLRPGLDDGRVSVAELEGYPVVLNFWASWCEPCKDEAPALAASARAHAGEVVFLGVDVQDFTSDARKFLAELDVPYASARDGGDSTYANYGLSGLPETYYLDRDGRIVSHSLGAISRRELEQKLAPALG
jgi:cytochrome c biogenesis protein CcmG/thiol:disulfide interchange protein DsbE